MYTFLAKNLPALTERHPHPRRPRLCPAGAKPFEKAARAPRPTRPTRRAQDRESAAPLVRAVATVHDVEDAACDVHNVVAGPSSSRALVSGAAVGADAYERASRGDTRRAGRDGNPLGGVG